MVRSRGQMHPLVLSHRSDQSWDALCILTASFNTTVFPTTLYWWNVQVYSELMWFYIQLHLIRMSTALSLSLSPPLSVCLHHFISGSSCDWFAADAAKLCHRAFRPKNNLHSLFILCFFPCLFYDFPPKAYVLVPSLQCRPLIDNCFSAY